LNLALLAWALVQVLWLKQPTILSAGFGLLVSGGLFLLLAIIGRGAMGLGDVKLAGVLGALLGLPLVLYALLIGVCAGGVAALYLLLSRRSKASGTMAYGPYLALGGWIVILGTLLNLWH
jgi:leader peptidase (prepilin peptidase) / N-methyltransferase